MVTGSPVMHDAMLDTAFARLALYRASGRRLNVTDLTALARCAERGSAANEWRGLSPVRRRAGNAARVVIRHWIVPINFGANDHVARINDMTAPVFDGPEDLTGYATATNCGSGRRCWMALWPHPPTNPVIGERKRGPV
jgi:hypothetical protein